MTAQPAGRKKTDDLQHDGGGAGHGAEKSKKDLDRELDKALKGFPSRRPIVPGYPSLRRPSLPETPRSSRSQAPLRPRNFLPGGLSARLLDHLQEECLV